MGQVHRRRRVRRLGRGVAGNSTCAAATPTPAPPTYAKERVDLAKKHGLEIFTVATHLQGQVLGDEPSAKTLNFCSGKGEARPAYKAWRRRGQQPAAHRPVLRPAEVGKLIHEEAQKDLLACVRLRRAPVEAPEPQGRAAGLRRLARRTAGATGSCSRRCRRASTGYDIPDVRQVSLELLVERFGAGVGPVQEVRRDVRPGVPPERAGDGRPRERRATTSTTWTRPGYEGVVGFNLDGSHMEWQNVSVIQFIREFHEYIHCAHVKGVWVAREHCRGGSAGRAPADGPLDERVELRDRRHRPRREQPRRDLHRAEPRGLRRGGVDRVGGQRRGPVRRGEGGAGELPQGRPAAQRHASTTTRSPSNAIREAPTGTALGRRHFFGGSH